MTWCAIGGISKKNPVAYLHMTNETFKTQISSIFHFDRVRDGRMAHILGVKTSFRCDFIKLLAPFCGKPTCPESQMTSFQQKIEYKFFYARALSHLL